VFKKSIASLLFLAAIASCSVAKEKVKQGVDLTGMKAGADGRYTYTEEADFTKYTTMYVNRTVRPRWCFAPKQLVEKFFREAIR
jgi:hypothetical protein